MPSSVGPATTSAEAEAVAAIVASLERTLAREYPSGSTVRRDAHPKHHGLVRAVVEVDDSVPPDLRHGVFAAPARYDAWIRFSNGSPRVQADTKKDQRGLALKLVGVPGDKLLEDERDAVTQDFLLASAPRFFIRDVSSYAAFAEAAAKRPAFRVLGYFLGWNPLAWRLRELRALIASLGRASDLLATRYWSQVPFRLGPHAVKYSLRPLDPSPYASPGSASGFLRERLAERLAVSGARFELLAQRFVDETRTPIEDATVEWREPDAPFERVATVTIPVQEFRTPAQDALAEHLSFTPWHSLPAHEPIGGTNRVRREVYRAISRYRHDRNGVPRREPRDLAVDPALAFAGGSGATGAGAPPRHTHRTMRLIKGLLKAAAALVVIAAVAIAAFYYGARTSDGPEAVDAAPLPPRPVPVVSHDLTTEERGQYYHLSEGGEIYPLDWILALEYETPGNPPTRRPFLDNIERYGMLPDPKSPQNPYGLPVGVSYGRSRLSRTMMIGLNCTACHVGQVQYQGHAVRVDGGPSMAYINRFITDMFDQTSATMKSPRRLARFWHRVREARAARRALGAAGEPPRLRIADASAEEVPEDPAPDEGLWARLKELVTQNRGLLESRLAVARHVLPVLHQSMAIATPDGYGRNDAFGVGRIELFGATPGNAVPPDAPVSFPHTWGMAHTGWLQWGANTNSVMERNIGQALGVGAVVDPKDWSSSVNIANLNRMERLTYKLQAPAWPAAFPAVDAAKAERGRKRFAEYCAGCHEEWTSRGAMRDYKLFSLARTGTDPNTALNYERNVMATVTRTAVDDRCQPVPGADGNPVVTTATGPVPFPVAALEIITKVKARAYADLQLDAAQIQALENHAERGQPTFRAPMLDHMCWDDTRGRKVYRAKTLVGIWATGPYLHNGSVPTIYDLLLPAAERPVAFPMGQHDIDPVKLGIETDESKLTRPPDWKPFTLDTRLTGNWNTGHEWDFYPQLDDTQRYEIIEFLKIFKDDAALQAPIAPAASN